MNKRLFQAACGAALALAAAAAPGLAQDGDSPSIFDVAGPIAIYDSDGFGYDLPDAAAEFPGLAEQLTAEREQARIGFDEMVEESREAMAGSSMIDHFAAQTHWVTPGRAGRLLSLAEATYVYSGGAHGNSVYSARLWDLAEDHRVDFTDLFTDRYAALAIIDRAFCAQLAAMQTDRGVPSDDSWWNGCPLLHEQAIAPGGKEGGRLDTIHIIVAPYVAGPYAAGSFEIAVPVTQSLIALAKPEYRDAFGVGE